jgi:hypothetical protein
MMLTFEEIARWSNDDINARILAQVPPGWKFALETTPEGWRATYQNAQGDQVYSEEHYALRILLAGAFIWLWQRLNPVRVHPSWRATPSRPLVPVRPYARSKPLADPADLDPARLRSVYAERARKR